MEVINCLPTIKDPNSPFFGKLEPRFWRYYLPPFNPGIFYDHNDPFNDLVTIIWGPRGGGKTTTGVGISIIDGQTKGIPVISNIPIAWIARDNTGKEYRVESIPFNIDQFVAGDPFLKFKRVLIDEGNYHADRLRSTSNKNMAVTDIMQQARKFRMPVVFCTINYSWIDPRITGSLCDIMIECNDLYYKAYGKKHHLRKGERCTWDIVDQSGKFTGKPFNPLPGRTFFSKMFWNTFNTENFVDPHEARKKLGSQEKTIIDSNGTALPQSEWLKTIEYKMLNIPDGEYNPRDWWDMLGVEDTSQKLIAGRHLAKLGIQKTGTGMSSYRKELAFV